MDVKSAQQQQRKAAAAAAGGVVAAAAVEALSKGLQDGSIHLDAHLMF
jgi:coenzyme F420-reducing hydrogenase beta subunit